ncbi:MFS transporter [Streptomyces sp. AV19]|uniref:peptide MFS transporter n=1 Tax=Streptomyces sp. AV19 TaxID=2793068 RepID=UPI0018FE7DE4|nr:oligopeptide:H+ symporter [Streptomyces sp. AV19]MBH1935800.1 MFS transporter [Streptomyces sp. AV19]MDG4536102.1 oligopeptide:H+ symporter [Streptomyces sp. AV19]
MGTFPRTSGTDGPRPGARPAWFRALFVSDLLERFGFYGTQAILMLYAAAPRDEGGLGMAEPDAAALFGSWVGLSFMLCLPGGLVADRLLGSRRTLLLGSATVAAGYAALAVPAAWPTAPGLILLAIGTGLYKPGFQALLGQMSGRDRGRLEAGISLIYVGIQLSALLSPLATGFLGERVDWHLGFALTGLAMTLGAVRTALGGRHFDGTGDRPGRPAAPAAVRRALRGTALAAVLLAASAAGGIVTGALTPSVAIRLVGLLTAVLPVAGYLTLYRNPRLTAADRRRLRTALWIFLGSALFWLLVAQNGSALTLFARDSTDRRILGFTAPVSWLQAATPLYILLLAPLFARLLPRAGRRGPAAVPLKFAAGLLLVGTSFLLMSLAAALAAGGERVSPVWLLVTYLLHACGELIVAAVGVAAVAHILPEPFLAQTLGLLWLFAALGGGSGAQLVRLTAVVPAPVYYLGLAAPALAVGAALAWRREAVAGGLADDPAGPSARTAAASRT